MSRCHQYDFHEDKDFHYSYTFIPLSRQHIENRFYAFKKSVFKEGLKRFFNIISINLS